MWNSQRNLVTHILVKDAHCYNGKGRENEVDQKDIGVVKEVRGVEVVVYLVPKEGEGPNDILGFLVGVLKGRSTAALTDLVEEIRYRFGQPAV